jgi:hypothetical protein
MVTCITSKESYTRHSTTGSPTPAPPVPAETRRDTESCEHRFCGQKPGNLGQARCRSEQRRVIGSSVRTEEPGRHVGLQVPDHAGVQMTAASLEIGRPERSHGNGVRVMHQPVDSWQAAGCLCCQQHGRRGLGFFPGLVNATARREFEPEQVSRDLQDSRPVREGIEIADGRTVLDPADLCLGESEPGAEKFLGDAVTSVACREFAMPTVGAGDAADVLGGERVAERGSVQAADTAGGPAVRCTACRSQEPHCAPVWFQARRFPHRQYLGAWCSCCLSA